MPFSFSSESGASGGEADAAARSEAEDAARLAQLERQRQEEQRRQIQDCKLNFRYFRLCSKKTSFTFADAKHQELFSTPKSKVVDEDHSS